MARQFTGTNQAAFTAPTLGTSYTFAVQVKSTLANAYGCVIDINEAFKFYIKSTGKTAFYNAATPYWDGTGTLTYSANTWYSAVITVTSGGTVEYLNNTQNNTAVSNPGSISGSTTYGFDTANQLAGALADGAMWSVILTSEERSALAAGARPFQIRQDKLLFYHPLDGKESTEPDLSGGRANATLTGTTFAAGPPVAMFTPRWPNNQLPIFTPTAIFRRTLSRVGTRTGSRQAA